MLSGLLNSVIGKFNIIISQHSQRAIVADKIVFIMLNPVIDLSIDNKLCLLWTFRLIKGDVRKAQISFSSILVS